MKRTCLKATSPTPQVNVIPDSGPHVLILLCQDDPDYFPTSTNWPIPGNASRAFMDMMETHIFEPLHVFTAAGRRVEPTQFARRLPGALVEVHFTLHHWYFSKDRFDSFNAYPKQVVIIKDAASSNVMRHKKKPARGIQRTGAVDSSELVANAAATAQELAYALDDPPSAGNKRQVLEDGL